MLRSMHMAVKKKHVLYYEYGNATRSVVLFGALDNAS